MSTGAAKRPELPYPRTLEVRDACLCLHVQRAARALGRRFDEAFRPLDLTNGQFSLLMSLNRPQPPSIGSVASLLAMDRTTLTAALKPLVRRGLVTLCGYGADGDGARHDLREEADGASGDQARLMLVTCSAFANYLVTLSTAKRGN